MPPKPKPKDDNSRRGLVEAVTTPLAFFVLVLLVSESILGALFFRAGSELGRAGIFAGMFVLLVSLVAIVTFLASTRPEVLYGKRPPKDHGLSGGLVALLYAIRGMEVYPDAYGHVLSNANPEITDGWRKASSYACLYLKSVGLVRDKGSEVALTPEGERFLTKLDAKKPK